MGKLGTAKSLDPALRDPSLSEWQSLCRGNRPTRIFARVLDHREQRKSDHDQKSPLAGRSSPARWTAILPHEVTHVVVADLFTVQQIPRWADEGIAVLAEPRREQNLRAADLRESLSSGQVFDLRQLMSIDTPEAKDWSLYYAQSVSLTRFLVEQGTPEQLIQFVREVGSQGNRAGPARHLPHRWVRGTAGALASLRQQQLASTK